MSATHPGFAEYAARRAVLEATRADVTDAVLKAYAEGRHDALRAALGSDGFRLAENMAALERVADAAFEEWIHG
jgi:hypothetical protein